MDALILRAQAKRELARDADAIQDVDAALALAPNNADALLLRGNLMMRKGDVPAARAAWIKARQAGGDASAGRAAAANLTALEKYEHEKAGTRSPAAPRQ